MRGGASVWGRLAGAVTLRCVERNSVRARLSLGPEEFAWSNSGGHWIGKDPSRMLDREFWREAGRQMGNRLEGHSLL